ncbi:hypothetical protein EDD17DRAFT_701170 [Pisolithus thermaeus]|nr:hypothetical protein EDD17DRAFT_701170 [Pisolithus thermaeus]
MTNTRNIVHPTHINSARCGVSRRGRLDNDWSAVKIIDGARKYTTKVAVGREPYGVTTQPEKLSCACRMTNFGMAGHQGILMHHGSKHCRPLTKHPAKWPPHLVLGVKTLEFQGRRDSFIAAEPCKKSKMAVESSPSVYDMRRLLHKSFLSSFERSVRTAYCKLFMKIVLLLSTPIRWAQRRLRMIVIIEHTERNQNSWIR